MNEFKKYKTIRYTRSKNIKESLNLSVRPVETKKNIQNTNSIAKVKG